MHFVPSRPPSDPLPAPQRRLRQAERLVACPVTTAPSSGRAALDPRLPFREPTLTGQTGSHLCPHAAGPALTHTATFPAAEPATEEGPQRPGFQLVGQRRPWERRANGELKNSSLAQLDEEPVPRDSAWDKVKTTLVFMFVYPSFLDHHLPSLVSVHPPACPGQQQMVSSLGTNLMEPGFAGTEMETEPTGRDVVREGRGRGLGV